MNIVKTFIYAFVSMNLVVGCGEIDTTESLQNNLQNAYFTITSSATQLGLGDAKVVSTSTKTTKERSEIIKKLLILEEKVENAYVYIDGKTAIIGVILADNSTNQSLQSLKDLVKSSDLYIQTVSITTNSYLIELIKELEDEF